MAFQRLVRIGSASERLFYGVLGFALVTILWELTADIGLYRKSLLSSPSGIVSVAIADFGSGEIWPHLGTSFEEFAIGFVIALVIGIPLGLAIGVFPRLDAFVSVLLYGSYSTPKAALVPLIILVTGIGITSKLVVVFLLAIFSVVVSIVAGVHAVSERHLDIARSFGASRWLTFRSVILPSTVPFHASQMYARNVTSFLAHLLKDSVIHVDLSDELTRGPLVTHRGEILHEVVKARVSSGGEIS